MKFSWRIHYTSERKSMLFSRTPVVSLSQPINGFQQLCRAKLQEPQNEAIQSNPCQGNRCKVSTAFVTSSYVTNNCNGRTFYSEVSNLLPTFPSPGVYIISPAFRLSAYFFASPWHIFKCSEEIMIVVRHNFSIPIFKKLSVGLIS